jgi:photosystem II stability/assembly factor-like uncharacterized protein
MKQLRLSALLLLICALSASAQSTPKEPYSWKSVQIVGGGFVDGVIFHSTAPGLRYARTDMGGAYRWDAAARRWQPLLDWVPYSDFNLMGIESIAVDPADPDRVYLACGTYTNSSTPNGAILRSNDRGQTFVRTDVPFKFGGNEDGRGNGERIAVDPRNGAIIYLGTRHDGLWRSLDHGATWTRVSSFPDLTGALSAGSNQIPGSGIVFVKYASPSALTPASFPTTIYAGVSLVNRANLFASTDGGASWHTLPGEPTAYQPTRAALSPDGFLYVSYGSSPGPSRMTGGSVWKLDTHTGAWTEITPDLLVAGSRKFGYAAVSVDSLHPRTLIVSSFGRSQSSGGEEIFRSTDGGTSWKPILGSGGVYDYRGAPYVKSTPIHWLFDIEIDPKNSDHAIFTTGYGGWETFDLTAADRGKPTHWSILAKGIEETVALDLNSPARGAHLVSAIGDYGGFVHWNLDQPAPEGSSEPPRLANTTGITSAALLPEVLVRVGVNAEHKPDDNISYSLDAGRTWQRTPAEPTPHSRAGSIAVSADGYAWIWSPEGEPASVTRDHGATWTAVQSLPAGLRAIADPVDAHSFYALSLRERVLYHSSDAAATFTSQPFTLPGAPPASAFSARGDDRGGQDRIYAAPGRAADLWLAAFDGLYHLLPPLPKTGSLAFVRLPGVEEIHAFGFGKAAPHHPYPALYLAGTIHGQPGVFRSTDAAQSWVRINDDQHQFGLILQIAGDPRRFGRIYLGTHGRGIFYGDPAHASQLRAKKTRPSSKTVRQTLRP